MAEVVARAVNADRTDDFARTLGAIERELQIFTKEFQRERDGAADHRKALRETITALSEAVRALTKEVADMKPLVQEYREARDQAKGAAKFGKLLWAGAIGCGAAIASIVQWIASHWPPRIP